MAYRQEDQLFEKVSALEGNVFEHCRFKSCDLSYARLSDLVFIDCIFEDCNLSLAVTENTGMQNVAFKNCKLSGVHFSKCRDFAFGVQFERCLLDNAVFFKRKMKGTKFTDCSMIEADLTQCDLTQAVFQNCNMERTFFDKTILKQADLRSSYNYIIDPEQNDIKKAKFSMYGLPGLLMKYGITVE
jgi:uncharacterized protein YjbI with pentapeptide repeats